MTEPVRLTAHRAAAAPDVDGRLTAPCWGSADWSARFVDLVSGGPTALDTRAAVLWDDDHLFVGFRLEECDVRAPVAEPVLPILGATVPAQRRVSGALLVRSGPRAVRLGRV